MKKGFTLVELLAVIAILAIILVIAVPQVNNLIKQTKTNSLASTAKIIAARAEEQAVANKLFGKTNSLNCSDLVKLDDNYGSCTVSVTNDVGTVTLVGTGKFAGITCTGTKNNMNCSDGSSNNNTPEYVYSYGRPHYEYTYTVTDNETCRSRINTYYLNKGLTQEEINSATNQTFINGLCNNGDNLQDREGFVGNSSEWFNKYSENADIYTVTNKNACITYFNDLYGDTAATYATRTDAICSNSNDIDGNLTSSSQWFEIILSTGDFTYEDISSFVSKTNIFDDFTTKNNPRLVNIYNDYTDMKYPGTNIQAQTFVKWPSNAVNYDKNDNPEVCFLHDNDLTCFEPKASAYSENVEKLTTIYGSENCIENSFLDEATDDYIYVTAYNEYETGINIYSNGQIDISLDIRYKCLGSSRFITCEVINGFF